MDTVDDKVQQLGQQLVDAQTESQVELIAKKLAVLKQYKQ